MQLLFSSIFNWNTFFNKSLRRIIINILALEEVQRIAHTSVKSLPPYTSWSQQHGKRLVWHKRGIIGFGTCKQVD